MQLPKESLRLNLGRFFAQSKQLTYDPDVNSTHERK